MQRGAFDSWKQVKEWDTGSQTRSKLKKKLAVDILITTQVSITYTLNTVKCIIWEFTSSRCEAVTQFLSKRREPFLQRDRVTSHKT
jgi:hypothetical protein